MPEAPWAMYPNPEKTQMPTKLLYPTNYRSAIGEEENQNSPGYKADKIINVTKPSWHKLLEETSVHKRTPTKKKAIKTHVSQ